MAILKTLAAWCEMIPRLHYLSIHDTIIQFEEVMLQQLDLRNEAKNLLCFCDHFKDSLHVSFPRPVSGMMHKEMLVETYEAGVPLSQIMTQDDKKLKKTCGQI